MEPPANGEEVKPENLEEAKEAGPMYHCDLLDSEVVHKIAQALLPGLASACVDNTTGVLMKSSGSVAIDIRREMVDYLVQRSENFVAESVILQGGPDVEESHHPVDIISDLIDDFVSSKGSFFSRVSGWVSSENREERIDDFLQEIESDGFWSIGRREAVAQTLLKNVDFKNEYHCKMAFKSPEELEEHRSSCKFQTIHCMHEGCNAIFSAAHQEYHVSVCPFKILPCEQKCPDHILRREMDKHCITVCPMKLVKCPFNSIGCQSAVPQCKIEGHCSDDLESHLLCSLRVLHKEVSTDTLKKRIQQIEELSSAEELATLHDARSLSRKIRDLDAKLGPLEQMSANSNAIQDDRKSIDKKESVFTTTNNDNEVHAAIREKTADSPPQE